MWSLGRSLGISLLIALPALGLQNCKSSATRPPPSSPSDASGTPANGLIAVAYRASNNHNQVFSVSPDGSNRAQLTNDDNDNTFPTWSPDGAKIVYLAQSSNGTRQIRLMNADGSNNQALTDPNALAVLPAHWSRSGTRIAYAEAHGSPPDPSIPAHIWVTNADGSNKVQLTSGTSNDYFPSWSQDDRYIAFTSNRNGGSYQIWRIDSDGSNPVQLTQSSFDGNIGAPIEQKVPAWSPDGKSIAYWHGVEMDYLSDGTKNGTAEPTARDWDIFHSWHIWLMNADGSNPHELTQGDDPSWSPDGSMIMHPTLPIYGTDPKPNGPGETVGVGATNLDGTNRHLLFSVPAPGPSGFSWQPID